MTLAKEELHRPSILMAAFGLAIFWPLLVMPFIFDNNVYHSQGWMLAEFGRLPYVGTWDQNLPAIIYLHAAVISVMGTNPVWIRLLDLMVQLGASWMLFDIVRRTQPDRVALTSALLYCVLYMHRHLWMASQRDMFGAVCLLAMLWLYLRAHDRRTSLSALALLMSGLLAGLAAGFRPTLAAVGCLIVLAILRYDRTVRLRWCLLFICGAVVAWILLLGPYLTHPERLTAMYDAVVRFNNDVYATTKFRKLPSRSNELINVLSLLGWVVLWMLPSHRKSRGTRKPVSLELFLLIGLLITTRIGIDVMGKYFYYHYHAFYMVLVVLFALLLERVGLLERLSRPNPLGITLAIALLFTYSAGKAFTVIQSVFTSKPFDVEAETRPLSTYLLQHGARGQRIEEFGTTPGIYWMTGTQSSSRFTSPPALVTIGPSGRYTPAQLRWQAEFCDSLRQHPPKFIVCENDHGMDSYYSRPSVEMVDSIPGFRDILTSRYVHDTSMLTWELYRLRE